MWGDATAGEKAMARVVTQFVGFAAYHYNSTNNKAMDQFRRQWSQIRGVEASRAFNVKGPGAELRVGSTPFGIGQYIWLSGGFGFSDARSVYGLPSDIARIYFHEVWHVYNPVYAGLAGGYELHQRIDRWARYATVKFGLGHCQAIGGFPRC